MSSIARFIDRLDEELRQVMPDDERTRTIDEIRAHLEESACEFSRGGEPDPEAMAVASFGDEKRLSDDLAASREGIGLPSAERQALVLAAIAVGLPVLADLTMALSSWFTGSDSATYLVGFPMAACAVAFAIRCTKVRRVLVGPIACIVLSGFLLSTVVGGFSQGVDPHGYGTRVRGTSWQSLNGLLRERLPQSLATVDQIRLGRSAFSGPIDADALSMFRVADGYLAPELPESWVREMQSEPNGARWVADRLTLQPRASFEEAAAIWRGSGAMLERFAQDRVDGDRREIAEQRQVVASPWIQSIRVQWPVKLSASVWGFGALLLLNVLGAGAGTIRRRRGRRFAR